MNTPAMRRYLLINPNTNALTTQRLQDTLLPRLPAGVQLDIRTARFRGASDPPAPPGGRRASRRWHDAEAVAAAVPRQQAAGRRRAANGAQLPPPERHRRQCRPWLPISRR